jgi:hypothetical protein
LGGLHIPRGSAEDIGRVVAQGGRVGGRPGPDAAGKGLPLDEDGLDVGENKVGQSHALVPPFNNRRGRFPPGNPPQARWGGNFANSLAIRKGVGRALGFIRVDLLARRSQNSEFRIHKSKAERPQLPRIS